MRALLRASVVPRPARRRFLSLAVLLAAGCAAHDREVILASTTSTQDSGLFDVLIPAFEAAHSDIRVQVIAVGSGQALALGRRRDADVLLVHSPEDEDAYVRAGHARRRQAVMYNDFVIVGPPVDPAQAGGSADIHDALRRIASARARFISRGDSSGTHREEIRLWRAAGVHDSIAQPEWRVEAGQGMGETLVIASERGAYTLTDRGTYEMLAARLRLDVIHEGGDALRNTYSVITVAGARNERGADVFADWLVSEHAARLIREYRAPQSGRPLFVPARAR